MQISENAPSFALTTHIHAWCTVEVNLMGNVGFCISDRVIPNENMSHLLLLGKFEYGGEPIFKVVLEC